MYKIYNDFDELVAQSKQEVDESILELLECLNYRVVVEGSPFDTEERDNDSWNVNVPSTQCLSRI